MLTVILKVTDIFDTPIFCGDKCRLGEWVMITGSEGECMPVKLWYSSLAYLIIGRIVCIYDNGKVAVEMII